MRKKILFVLLLVMLFPFVVKAQNVTVTSFNELKTNNIAGNVLNYTGTELTLTEDITLVAPLYIKANTALNLNGHKLTLAANSGNYTVVVFDQLTINGEGTVIVEDDDGFCTSGSGSPKLIVNGGTFTQTAEDYMFGIFAGEMIFNDGTFTAPYCVVNNFSGLYNLDGKLTINGGTFKTTGTADWGDGTIMNSGVAEISGGTFTSEGNDGTYGFGSAIYTDSTGTTTISRGTFNTTGQGAVTIYNLGNTVIENGSFESTNGNAIENDTAQNANASLTLIGGSFSDSANSVAPFVDNDSAQYTNNDGDEVVVPRDVLVVKTFSVLNNASDADLALINGAMSDGFQLGKTFDVTAWLVNPNDNNAKVEQLTETTQEVKVTLDVSDLPDVPQGMVREFEVVKVHNGVAEALQATDNGNGTISTTSKEFSTYAVTFRDTESVQNREGDYAVATTGNPNTHDTILLFVLLMMVGLTGTVITSKKLANR